MMMIPISCYERNVYNDRLNVRAGENNYIKIAMK